MRIVKAWIDGYGRFSEKELDLDPGLQVITGPNEQGKSTLRHFVGDMLYGQKRSTHQRVYESSNELRMPWNKGNGYGGRLLYSIDAGRLFEVQRSFDRKDEWVRVFDRTDSLEITSQFTMHRNREPAFADEHLHMSKAVFLNVATISHLTLEDLGNHQALGKIRSKLLSLTDSGESQSSTEGAMKWLSDRITAIGQPSARTKPLPLARTRLVDLQKEYEQVRVLREDVGRIDEKRLAVHEEIAHLLGRRSELEDELEALKASERAGLLLKAEELAGRIDAITKHCFELGSVRDFPLEQIPEVQRLATLVSTAEMQENRTEGEVAALDEQIAAEKERIGPDSDHAWRELDPEYETRLADLETQIRGLGERKNETDALLESSQERYEEAQKAISKLPDFGRISADPVEWLTQLASSFGVAVRTRDDEKMQYERRQEAVDGKQRALEHPETLFEDTVAFAEEARAYESAIQEQVGQREILRAEMQGLKTRVDELMSRIPGFTITGLLSLSGAAVCVAVGLLRENPGLYIPAGLFALMLLFSVATTVVSRRGAKKSTERLEQAEEEIRASEYLEMSSRQRVENLMEQAGCESVRELEAIYDKYREDKVEYGVLEDQRSEQEKRAQEAADRVEGLFARLRETFLRVGEELSGEEDVQAGAMRAIGRYQEYREAKRRSLESREQVERRDAERSRLSEEIATAKEQELALSLEVRQFLRENGYEDEHKSDRALQALRGYRMRSAQLRDKLRQVEVLEGQRSVIYQQLEEERSSLEKNRVSLSKRLEHARAKNMEEYRGRTEKARDYVEQWKERGALEDQLKALLGEQDLETLRAGAATSDSSETAPRGEETIKEELRAVQKTLEEKGQESHALHIKMTELDAGTRSINIVDEERSELEGRLMALEMEVQACSYAMSILDDVSRERHSRVAPQLAELSSAYLSEITDNFYDEIHVSRDLQISVRIPQTKTLSPDPEKRLSKGTVDQIYLALRLGMVKTMSETGETIPMLLDDPFANYDDARLLRAMKLLSRIGRTNQILLFTCRDDVTRAAKKVKAPIIEL